MLEGIIGHSQVKEQLGNMLQEKNYNRTFMFYGPPCTGKRTTSFEFARTLLCENKKGDDCTCQSCTRFNSSGHPDFLCIGRDGKIKVADVELVLGFTEVAPFLSGNKVVVIDNADSITWEASNRLLKTLEEPPSMFVFILITSTPDSILQTVRSRCIRIKFNALEQIDMVNVIFQKIGFELPKARILGWIGHGSSVDIFSKAGKYLKYRDIAVDFLSGIKSRKLLDSMDFIDKIGKNDIDVFVDMVILVMTDIIMVGNHIDGIVNIDLRDDLKKIAHNTNMKAFIGAVGNFSQIKKYQHLNINLSYAMKNALIKSHLLLTLTESPA
jgi:DNA polymerase-3 subunit delta'